jgi:phosphatidate phosphatase PAH1
MALNFKNLDDQTRRFLQEELLIDIERKSLYLSKRLNDTGLAKYPESLRQAMKIGNDFTLAREL